MEEIYSLGFLVHRASTALSQAITNALGQSGYDLPHSQFIVLRALYYKDSQSQYELARFLCKDAAAIKRTIDNLELKGLARRTHACGLKNLVTITEKGRGIMPGVIELGKSITEKALSGIGEEDREKLLVLLDQIYNNLEK